MDAECFKKEFLPYHRKLYCIACKLLDNTADAEDLIQEAYLKLWDKRVELVAVNNTEAFSVALVKNMCFDLLRSDKYIRNRQALELTVLQDAFASDNLEERDEVRYVRTLITGLPRQQQQVITLRDVRGCSYEEIEQITGLTSVNIRVLLSRARKKIREEFVKCNSYESRRS